MHTELSPSQIEHYRRDGFVVLEDVLDADELAAWRSAVDAAVTDRLSRQDGLNNQGQGADPFYAKVFTQALRLSDTDATMRTLVRDERLAKVAGELEDVSGIRLWHDQALVKPPYGNQTTWHRDTPYWSFHTRHAVNYWIALDDATLENGCLWYLSGTHRLGAYNNVPIGRNMSDLFDAYPEWASIAAVPVPVRAGSIVVHNAMVAHGAGANMTNRPRRAMTMAYFPDGETYNGQPDTLAKRYVRRLAVGQPLDDDRYLPLLWTRDGHRAPDTIEPEAPSQPPSLAEVSAMIRAACPTSKRILLDFGKDGRILWDGASVHPAATVEPADVTVRSSLATWGEMLDGLDPRVAYLSGRLAIDGSVEDAAAVWALLA